MPGAKCMLLTTTTLYIGLTKDARFQSIRNLQPASKEEKDLPDYVCHCNCYVLKHDLCFSGLYLSLPKKPM